MTSDTQIKQKRQDVFDLTVKHLAQQGVPAYGPIQLFVDDQIEGCVYRGPNNTKCAIGFWIPDSVYTPDMENRTFNVLKVEYKHVLPEVLLDPDLTDLFESLQTVHDAKEWATDTELFRFYFKRIAEQFGLNLDVLNSLELNVPVTT